MDSNPNMGEIDPIAVDCNVRIDVCDAATGELLEREELHNLVTLAGRNLIRDLLNESTDSGLTHFAVGGTDTAPAAGDTQLAAEIYRDTFTKRTAVDGVLTLTYFLPSGAANGSTLREAGLLNAAAGGVLFARAVFGAIAKTASVTVTYTWSITIGAS